MSSAFSQFLLLFFIWQRLCVLIFVFNLKDMFDCISLFPFPLLLMKNKTNMLSLHLVQWHSQYDSKPHFKPWFVSGLWNFLYDLLSLFFIANLFCSVLQHVHALSTVKGYRGYGAEQGNMVQWHFWFFIMNSSFFSFIFILSWLVWLNEFG